MIKLLEYKDGCDLANMLIRCFYVCCSKQYRVVQDNRHVFRKPCCEFNPVFSKLCTVWATVY